MVEIVNFPKIIFEDATQELKSKIQNPNYPYECWRCWYGKTYLGLISWSDENEQYGFYPQTDMQTVMTTPIMRDIYDKMWELMKNRTLN